MRRDNNPYLFPDRFQGWPASPGGYSDLIDALAGDPLVSFRFGAQVYHIRNFSHSFASIERAARDAGMKKLWEVEASFGMPEKRFFLASGKEDLFAAAQKTPAIFARCWSSLY